MSETHTFYLHYWPHRPVYVCLRDDQKRPFDFTDGVFRPLTDLQTPSRACILAEGKLDSRADYGCSYSVQIDLSRLMIRDGNAAGLKEGEHLELFWLLQKGDSPLPNQDEVIGSSCRMVLSDGQFTPVDAFSGKMLDEEILFAEKRQREEEYGVFREAEQQWQDSAYDRSEEAVKDILAP